MSSIPANTAFVWICQVARPNLIPYINNLPKSAQCPQKPYKPLIRISPVYFLRSVYISWAPRKHKLQISRYAPHLKHFLSSAASGLELSNYANIHPRSSSVNLGAVSSVANLTSGDRRRIARLSLRSTIMYLIASVVNSRTPFSTRQGTKICYKACAKRKVEPLQSGPCVLFIRTWSVSCSGSNIRTVTGPTPIAATTWLPASHQ